MIRLRAQPPLLSGDTIPGDPDGRCDADVLLIAGEYSPGLCVISKAGIPYNWDKRKGYGFAGAWLIFTGDDLAEFDTTFTVWREDQRLAWNDWRKKYLSKPPAQPQQNGAFLPNMPKPKALEVYNPILAELGITQMVPKHIGQWNQVAIGKWQKVVEWYQFRPPVPLIGRPTEGIPKTKDKPPTAQDAIELENRAKRQDIEARQKYLALHHK